MTGPESTPASEALQLTRKVMRTHDEVATRWGPAGAAAERSHGATLNDALGVWAPGNPNRLPDEGARIVHLPIEGEAGRFGRKRAVVTRLCMLAGTLPGAAVAQVLLVRPNETVVAFSRRAGTGEVTRAAETLRAAVSGWSRAGDGSAFSKEGSAARSDYWHPRPAWQLTASGLIPAPQEPPPVVDYSTAVVLSVPGSPDAGEVVADLWSSLHDGGRRPAGAFALRVAEIWAWAAVDGLIDTLGLVATRLDADVRDAGWGVSRDGMLGRVRERLTNPRAVLDDDPYTSLWKRLGVRRVSADEQDTLVLEPGRGMPLRVELVPAWFREDGPPARAVHTAERTVVEVNVAAPPERVEAEVWSCVARGLALPRATPPCTTADLRLPMEPSMARATSARLTGLAERYERAVAFARDLAGP